MQIKQAFDFYFFVLPPFICSSYNFSNAFNHSLLIISCPIAVGCTPSANQYVSSAVFVNSLNLLTSKPVIYATNASEDDLADEGENNAYVAKVREFAATENAEVVVVCAQIEAEIAELDTEEEKKEFLETLGLEQSGLDKLIKSSYALLGLISYLTAGPQEVRAWTIKKGTKAPQAAGKIHSDFERG